MNLTDEAKADILKKVWYKVETWILSEWEHFKRNRAIANYYMKNWNPEILARIQNYFLNELYSLTYKLEDVKESVNKVEKYANIWDILIDFWPLLIFMFHDDDYFYNDRYMNVMWLNLNEISELFFNGGFSNRVYWWDTFDKFKDRLRKTETWQSITQQLEITRKNLEKLWVLWNAHRCTKEWSSIWVWMVTNNKSS